PVAEPMETCGASGKTRRSRASSISRQPRSRRFEMHVFDTAELRLLRAVERHVGVRRRIWQSVRALGALSLLAVGAVHLQQYLALYSVIPTIGTLFLLNFVGATAIGLGLLAPVEHLLGRFGAAALLLLTAGGIGLAAAAFVLLLISGRTPLFGFMEPGYD